MSAAGVEQLIVLSESEPVPTISQTGPAQVGMDLGRIVSIEGVPGAGKLLGGRSAGNVRHQEGALLQFRLFVQDYLAVGLSGCFSSHEAAGGN